MVPSSLSWKQILLDNKQFWFLYIKDCDNLTFLVHDFVNIYIEKLGGINEYRDKVQKCNPDLEDLDSDAILDEVLEVIGTTNCKSQVDSKPDEINLSLNWDSDDLPINFNFRFRLGSAQDFFDYVTCKLLSTVDLLLSGQQDLFKIIRDKDIELGEFKHSGLKVTRPHLRTKWFEPREYLKTVTISNNSCPLNKQNVTSALIDYLRKIDEDKTVNTTKEDSDKKAEEPVDVNDAEKLSSQDKTDSLLEKSPSKEGNCDDNFRAKEENVRVSSETIVKVRRPVKRQVDSVSVEEAARKAKIKKKLQKL